MLQSRVQRHTGDNRRGDGTKHLLRCSQIQPPATCQQMFILYCVSTVQSYVYDKYCQRVKFLKKNMLIK
jgi:hypothetical protein